MAIQIGDVPVFLFVASEFAIVLVLFALNPHHRASRAFALLILFRSFTALFNSLRNISDDPLQADLWTRLLPYTSMPTTLLVLYFLSVYPAPRRWLPRGPAGPLLFMVPAVALVGLYIFDHRLFFGAGIGGPPAAPSGPLAIMIPILRVTYLVAAVVLARAAFREPLGARRSTLLLVSAGFAPWPILQGLSFLLGGGFAQPFTLPYLGAFACLLALVVVLVGVLARAAAAPGPQAHAPRWYLAVVAGFALVAVPVLLLPAGPLQTNLSRFLTGLALLPLPFVTVYALLRHEMFDIRLRFKWTVKQSTIAAVFIGVFFVVSESAQQFFATDANLGPYLGIGAAGLLVFALAPLQRAAERVADVAVPGVRPVEQLGHDDRVALYRDQVRFAWSDGRLTDDERGILDHLRGRLGLSPETAARLEREVTDERAAARSMASSPLATRT